MRYLLSLPPNDGIVVSGLTLCGLANSCFGALLAAGPHNPNPAYGALMGAFGAQVGLIAIWTVLGTSGYSRRILFLVGASLFLVATLAFGSGVLAPIAGHNGNWSAALATAFRLPMLLLALQLPFWLARVWFAWRIVLRKKPGDIRNQRIGTRDLMIATAVVASCLGAARLAAPSTSSSADFLISCIREVLFLAVLCCGCIVPAVVATLRARLVWLAIPAAVCLGCAAISAYLAYIVMNDDGVGLPTSRELYWLSATVGGFSLTLIVALLSAKWLGYALLWGSEVTRSTQPAG